MVQLPTLCAEASEYVGEPLAGTAAFATTWFFVEERGTWAPQAIESAGLREERALLEGWLAAMPNARLQLIRRRGRSGPRRVYIAEPAHRRVRRFDVEALDEVDIHGGEVVDEPLFFVCTHGKRDRCCALRGNKLFAALEAEVGPRAWQTSHLGGHRFAATMLSLPHGYCFGRIETEEAPAIVREGIHDLGKLRGRVSYRGPVQAGEIALRQHLGLRGLDDVEVLRFRHTDSEWTIHFGAAGKRWIVRVVPEITGTLRPKSCGGDVEAVEVFPCLVEEAR